MKVISQEALARWLEGLMNDYAVIAPKRVDEFVFYESVATAAEVAWDYERPKLSAKEYLWPDTESILTIRKGSAGVQKNEAERTFKGTSSVSVEAPMLERPQVLFGLRPCDARGLCVLDAILLANPADAYYADKRAKTTIVGIACPRMFAGCFCTSLGSSPDDWRDVDIMLTAVNGGYAVDAVTEKGQALAASMSTQDRPVEPKKAEATAPAVPTSPSERWLAVFENTYWARLGDRCLSCRVCTFVCPTCRCFDVRDFVAGNTIQRLRSWDACQSAAFCKIASGYNPKPTPTQRLRQRFMCKFSYVPTDFGPVACIGCGRCVVECPVNIDIREVAADVAAL